MKYSIYLHHQDSGKPVLGTTAADKSSVDMYVVSYGADMTGSGSLGADGAEIH